MADMDVLQALAVLVARRDEVVALIARLDDAARLAGELGMAAAAEEVAEARAVAGSRLHILTYLIDGIERELALAAPAPEAE